MSNYYTPATALTDIANAIRNKAEIGVSLSWPNDFITAINSIQNETCVTINEEDWIENNISSIFYNPNIITIGYSAFHERFNLTTVSFPACTHIGSSAFSSCSALTTVGFPTCTYIGDLAFYGCSALTAASFPACTIIGRGAFWNCSALTTASFPMLISIDYSDTFHNCYNLISLYLTGSSYVSLHYSTTFSSTPIDGYSTVAGRYGSIYVPASMLSTYKIRTNWTYFSDRMVGI